MRISSPFIFVLWYFQWNGHCSYLWYQSMQSKSDSVLIYKTYLLWLCHIHYLSLPSVESVWVDLSGPFYWFPRQSCRSLSAAFHHNLSLFFLIQDGGTEAVDWSLKVATWSFFRLSPTLRPEALALPFFAFSIVKCNAALYRESHLIAELSWVDKGLGGDRWADAVASCCASRHS